MTEHDPPANCGVPPPGAEDEPDPLPDGIPPLPNPLDDNMKLLWPAVDNLSSAGYALSVAADLMGADTLMGIIFNTESAVADSAAGLYRTILQAQSSGTDDDQEFVYREYSRLGELRVVAWKLWGYTNYKPNPQNPPPG